MRALVNILSGLITAGAFAGGAGAEDRLALLIGNEDYPASVGRLSLPHEDVARIEAALAADGFEVTTLLDADEDATELALARFEHRLADAGADAVGFFYYSGHGVSAVTGGRRRNYLIPARADVTDADTLAARGVEEEEVIDILSDAGARAVFIVIDACRNELAPAFSRSAADKGFGVTASRPGLFIAHSTFPGATAPDDGAFSAALARQLTAPETLAERAFTLAYREVAASRQGYALPTVAAALTEDFCFVSCPGDAAPPSIAPAAPAPPSAEELVREAQLLLAAMGYDPGPADGRTGARTGDAVAAFRAAAGLSASREIDADLVTALNFFQAQGHRAPSPAASPAPAPPQPIVEPQPSGSSRQPGDTFRDCDACPEMVVIPAGEFVMGSPRREEGRERDEGPQRTVRIASFASGRFEVTWDEWEACVRGSGCEDNSNKASSSDTEPQYRGDSGWGRASQPVINVDWNDAQAYARWLSRETGQAYRLLTEAEWEYSARAGSTGRYAWGSQEPTCATSAVNGANFRACGDERTHPVGSYHANALGLHDMHGNVSEWVEDCYRSNYADAPTDGSAVTLADCGLRILRGGSWLNLPGELRSALRHRYLPTNRFSSIGFRVARTL